MNLLIVRDFSKNFLNLIWIFKIKKIILISRANVAADMAGAITCCYMAMYVHATWQRMCAHVSTHMCAHAHVISGLTILFSMYAKPIKCTHFTYPIFCLNYCHVGLFFFIFYVQVTW